MINFCCTPERMRYALRPDSQVVADQVIAHSDHRRNVDHQTGSGRVPAVVVSTAAGYQRNAVGLCTLQICLHVGFTSA